MKLVNLFVLSLFIILAFLATGCSTVVPVKQKFPPATQSLMIACPDLTEVKETEKLSDVLSVVTKNYSDYHQCRFKVDSWIEWYKTQQQEFDKK
jgi:hypothetical protein